MRKLYCYSFKDFNELVNTWNGQVPPMSVVISIISSPKLREDNERHLLEGERVLNLCFDDITDQDALIPNTRLFDFDIANEIYDFVEKYIDEPYNFYVHCSAGVSRSQAIIKYILNNYPDRNWVTRKENPCQFPNYYVLGMLNKVNRAWYEKDMNKVWDELWRNDN